MKPIGMVIFLFGPCGSGKTTFALKNMRDGDLILDIDRLIRAITKNENGERQGDALHYAILARDAILDAVTSSGGKRVWFTSCIGDRREQDALVSKYRAKKIVFDVDAKTCLERIVSDPTRKVHIEKYSEWVNRWWQQWGATA